MLIAASNSRGTDQQESMRHLKINNQALPLKQKKHKTDVNLLDRYFKVTILKVFKELKKDVEKVKKIIYEQNGSINKDTEPIKRN